MAGIATLATWVALFRLAIPLKFVVPFLESLSLSCQEIGILGMFRPLYYKFCDEGVFFEGLLNGRIIVFRMLENFQLEQGLVPCK